MDVLLHPCGSKLGHARKGRGYVHYRCCVVGASPVVERRSSISYENSDLDMLDEGVAQLMAESGVLHSNAEVDDDGDDLFMSFVDEFLK